MYKQIILSVILSLILLSTTQGQNNAAEKSGVSSNNQDSINFSLAIPFNDNNVWGWSDTLGNIVIKPAFKRTYFFTNGLIGERKFYYTSVKTESGNSYYISDIGLAVPAEYKLLSWELGITSNNHQGYKSYQVIKDKNKKIGIFESFSQEMIVSPRYDTLSKFALTEDIILLREKGKKTFDYFSTEEVMMQKTEFTEVDYMSIYNKSKMSDYCCDIIGKLENGKAKKIYKGNLTPFLFVDSLKYTSELNSSMMIEDIEELIPIYEKKVSADVQPDKVLATHDYSRFGKMAEAYGFSILKIVRKNNKVGIVNESDKIIVPFDYDKIQFSANFTEAQLYKDGKQGRKMFFTKYPLIPAKYDSLKSATSLKVKPRWSFGVYEIMIGNFKGFVGENGVEYFKLPATK